MRLAIDAIRGIERILPSALFMLFAWPVAAIIAARELSWARRPPFSLRPRPLGIFTTWRRRINLNLTKLLMLWPDRLMRRRWRRRSPETALEWLRPLIAGKQPVVLATVHVGPLAVLRYWLRAHGVPAAGLVEKRLSQRARYRFYLDSLSDNASGLKDVTHVFDLTQLRQAAEFLRRGNVLIVAVDAAHGHTVSIERAETVVRMATGAVRLAALTHGIVVPCLARAHRAFGLTMHVGRPIAADDDVPAACARLMDELLPVVRTYPEQFSRR